MRFVKISLLFASVFSLFLNLCYAQDPENVFEESMRVGSLRPNNDPMDDDMFVTPDKVINTSLTTPVTISLVNKSLDEGLQQIAKKTGIKLLYNDNLVNNLVINYGCNCEPLRKVLDIVLADKGISYREFKKGQIVLYKAAPVAEKNGSIKGIVKDEKGDGLYGANVVIAGTPMGATTDLNGHYTIKNLKPGTYTVVVSFVSYESIERKVVVGEGKTITVDFTLKPTAFQIGGIEVVGKTDLLPTDVATKTVISSGEIEHYQASSIKDVLDLVPGVQKTENPGLGKSGFVATRGDETDRSSSFGTLVVVDGTPVSNNSNLQFEKYTTANTGSTNTGAGVDLRSIPADNIESIEVVTGLPSVKYGDATEGLINIKTKIGSQPNRLKVKNNPDTREANLGGGFSLSPDKAISYNINYATSERDIRKTGDEFSRVTGQTVYSSKVFDNTMTINHKLNGQLVFDEEAPKGDAYKINNYNRGYSLGYSTWGKTTDNDVSFFEYNAYVSFHRENSMQSKLVQSSLRVVNGDTISAYIGKVETKGNEWNLGGRLEWNKIFYTGDIVHKTLIGTDIQYNANTGEGVMFDTLFSYYGPDAGKRPYSFNNIPGQTLVSLYAEDKITGHLIFDYNIMLGARYEMYRPFQFNLKGLWGDGDLVKSHQGSFFNPRMNMMVYLSKNSQVRFSTGVTSKSPAMSTMYMPDMVYKWRNPYTNKIINMIYDRKVPDLQGTKEFQCEVAFDQRLFNTVGLSIDGYYKERHGDNEGGSMYLAAANEGKGYIIPVYITAYDNNNQPKLFYVDKYSIAANLGWTITRGAEFSLKTNKIKPLNMDFQVTGSYMFINSSRNGLSFDGTPDINKGQIPNNYVKVGNADTAVGYWYIPEGKWNDRFQLNYYVRYTLAPLGLWVTLRAEQTIFERNQTYNQEYEDYNLLTVDGKSTYLFNREIKKRDGKWLFNLSISKSLFRGAEVSFYVNNFLDDPGTRLYQSSTTTYTEEHRNPPLFYGIEFSCTVDDLFRRGE